MEIKLIQKAYNVWHDGMIGYGPEIANSIEETEIVYADKPSEAKSNANDWVNWDLESKDPKYTDLRCRRNKSYDIVSYKGKNMKRFMVQVENENDLRNKKLDEILENKNIKYCYICKNGFYRPNFCGYTDFKHRAGVYTKEIAVAHARGVKEIYLERIDIDEHNKMIYEEIKELESRLINNQ